MKSQVVIMKSQDKGHIDWKERVHKSIM